MFTVYTFVSNDILVGGIEMNFHDVMESGWVDGRYVCVGLDTDINRIPKVLDIFGQVDIYRTILGFNCHIINAVHSIVNVFKVNPCFYYARGCDGYRALEETINYIHEVGSAVIFDGKCGDIENTNLQHAHTAFEHFGADAVTVNPLVDPRGIDVFYNHSKEKAVFVICYPSTENFFAQSLYKDIACYFAEWDGVGFVVGASNPKVLRRVRKIVGDKTPILVPGIGSQGGDVAKSVSAVASCDDARFLAHSSRRILYSSSDCNFAEVARYEVEKLNAEIASALANC